MTILSREEAMRLPVEERPLCYRLPGHIYHKIFESIGAASMAWKPAPSSEVFDTSSAEKIAVDLCFFIAAELEKARGIQSSPAPDEEDGAA